MNDKHEEVAAPAPIVDDAPGKISEPAAPSGAEPTVEAGMSPAGQGAQVVLTGDAQAAARGGLHGTVEQNTVARDTAIADGHVEAGTTAAAAADAMTGAPVAEELPAHPVPEAEPEAVKPTRTRPLKSD